MLGESGSCFVIPQVAEFAECEAVPVDYLRCMELDRTGRHRILPACDTEKRQWGLIDNSGDRIAFPGIVFRKWFMKNLGS